MTTAAITGHRPEKLHDLAYIDHQLHLAYKDLKVRYVIQGMAAGVDLMSARAAYQDGIAYGCARPWKGHAPRRADEYDYFQAIAHAQDIWDVDNSRDYPGPWVYQKRNEFMVDNSDIVIAVWDGSSGGTANCVKYALKKGRMVWRIFPDPHMNDRNGFLAS